MNELRHRPLLVCRLCVFLAQVPVEREVVTEARDQLAQIDLPFGAQGTAVESFRHGGGQALATLPSIVDFRFLELEVQVQPEALGVGKHDFPLVELGGAPRAFRPLYCRSPPKRGTSRESPRLP